MLVSHPSSNSWYVPAGGSLTGSQWHRAAQTDKNNHSSRCLQTLWKMTFIYWHAVCVRALNLGTCNRRQPCLLQFCSLGTADAYVIQRAYLKQAKKKKKKEMPRVITTSCRNYLWIMHYKTRWQDPHFSAALWAVIFFFRYHWANRNKIRSFSIHKHMVDTHNQ